MENGAMGRLICRTPPEGFVAQEKTRLETELQGLLDRLNAVISGDGASPGPLRDVYLNLWLMFESIAHDVLCMEKDLHEYDHAKLKAELGPFSLRFVEVFRKRFPDDRDLVALDAPSDAVMTGFRIGLGEPPASRSGLIDSQLLLIERANTLNWYIPRLFTFEAAHPAIRAMIDHVKTWPESSDVPEGGRGTVGVTIDLLERLAAEGFTVWGGDDGIGANLVRIVRSGIEKILAGIPAGELQDAGKSRIRASICSMNSCANRFYGAFKKHIIRYKLLDRTQFEFVADVAPALATFERKMEWMAGLAVPAELLRLQGRHQLAEAGHLAKARQILLENLNSLQPGPVSEELKRLFLDKKQQMAAVFMGEA